MRQSLVILMMVFAVLTACDKKPEKPADLIPEEEMIQVLADVSLVEAKFQRRLITPGQNVNEVALKNYTALFKMHHITADQFRSSYLYYQQDPEHMKEMYEQVLVELSSREAEEKRVVKSENKKKPKPDSLPVSDSARANAKRQGK